MTHQYKRLILISQYFYPEMISTGHILTELIIELVKQGIKANVVCAQPTYYSNDKVDKDITYKGINIKRTDNTQFDKNSLKGKIFNSFSFFVIALWFLLKEKGRHPIVLVTNPPFLGLIGLICRILKRRSYLLIIHDLYPDIAINMGYLRHDSLLALLWNRINQKIYKAASFIVVLGRDVQKNNKDQLPVEQHEKVVFIPNWADSDLICPVDPIHNPFMTALDLNGKFLVQYSGNMGLTHDMETIIEAAQVLRDNEDIHFILIGGGGKLSKIKKMVGNYELSNVSFLPYQPRETLKYSLCSSHVSIISLERGAEGLSVPSKLYGIMASGRPIIAIMSENTEVALTLKEFKCGIVIPPKDVLSLVKSITWLKDNESERKMMGLKAYNAFLKNFTVQHCAEQYHHLLKQMFSERQLPKK
jgi:glycosyltransferase involved in cell wall biosynthesis